MRSLSVLFLPAVLLAVACGDDEQTYTSVAGHASVDLGAGGTGFEFVRSTRIDDDRIARPNGPIAGHCTIAEDVEGATTVSFGVSRTDDATAGLHDIEILVLPDMVAVDATVHGGAWTGAADCAGLLAEADADHATASVRGTCGVTGPAAETGTLDVDLAFEGCDLE
jgi:hypothetical protein